MNLTRFGFNMLVAVYLIPLVIIDFVGNTVSTGFQSELYYYKTMFDGLLLAYAIWELFTDNGTASVSHAQHRVASGDSVVSFDNISAAEYIYCLFLCVYAAANWWELHLINREATGIVSMASLVWSFMSLAVCILSAVQFYRIKSGALVELKHRVMS